MGLGLGLGSKEKAVRLEYGVKCEDKNGNCGFEDDQPFSLHLGGMGMVMRRRHLGGIRIGRWGIGVPFLGVKRF